MDNAQSASNVQDEQIRRLINTYGTALLRICYVYLKDASLAEDAMQDTFVKAYRNLGQFVPGDTYSEKAWLMRIAINTCKDYRRSAWFRHVDKSVTPDDMMRTANLLPDQKMLLEDVLDLPAKYKEVLLLYYYQGLTVSEIGKILGLAKPAVYMRLERARQKLRIDLERGDFDE